MQSILKNGCEIELSGVPLDADMISIPVFFPTAQPNRAGTLQTQPQATASLLLKEPLRVILNSTSNG